MSALPVTDIPFKPSPTMRLFVTPNTAAEAHRHLTSFIPSGGLQVLSFRRKDCERNMSHHKGKQQAKSSGRDFPHVVEIAVPPNGLGNALIAMYDFHARHGIEVKRGHGRREHGGNFMRWCFAESAIAAAFASEFKR